jgi:hypothetical protein
MKKLASVSDRSSRIRNSAITNSALADFLVKLAALYAPPDTGNPDLSTALRKLAGCVRRGVPFETGDRRLPFDQTNPTSADELEFLRNLDLTSVKNFISDETKSKHQLIDLAAARFSIPRSRLRRMNVADVRQVINSALLHESTIEILSEEAKRDGSTRSS